MKKNILQYLPSVFLTGALLLMWELVVRFGQINPRILPMPSQVFIVLFTNWDIIFEHSIQTTLEAGIGLGISVILGWLIAIVIDNSSTLKKSVYPLLITSQTIPMIALAPLLLLWFGFSLFPKVIVVTLYCFFPIVISLADGFAHVNQDFITLLTSMGASKVKIYKLVKIPGSLPQFFSGLKIAATYAVSGAIVGEYVGAEKGLGIFMQQSANSYAIALVFAGIIVTAGISLLFVVGILLLEHLLVRWK